MDYQVLGIEELEAITFERSKNWAMKLEEFAQREDRVEVDLSDLDNIFEDYEEDGESDDEEALAQPDEAEVVDDIECAEMAKKVILDLTRCVVNTTTTPGQLNFGPCKTKDERDQQSEIQNIFNETLPIIQEHKRKWQAAGIERILNTFDANKIEKQVGDWLRRNNSGYMDNSLCRKPNQSSSNRARYFDHCTRKSSGIETDDPSEAESMHSVDTARYIRSSRKRHGKHRALGMSTSCTTMTIKTYRMVKSKRDELRQKYGCGMEYDEDHHRHMQRLRCSRRLRLQQEMQLDATAHCRDVVKRTAMKDVNRTQMRRKQLRKRRSDSSMLDSSDMDDYDCRTDSQPLKRQIAKSPRCCSRNRTHDYVESISHSNLRRFERSVHMQSYVGDCRPLKRESECRCCNDATLCRDVRHVANSSTEDWLVENGDSPLPLAALEPLSEHTLRAQSVRHHGKYREHDKPKKIEKSKPVDFKGISDKCEVQCIDDHSDYDFDDDDDDDDRDYVDQMVKSKKKSKSRTTEPNLSAIPSAAAIKDKSDEKKSKSKARTITNKKSSKKADKEEEYASEVELQRAFELSKKSTKKVDEKQENDSFDAELQRAIELSKRTYELEASARKFSVEPKSHKPEKTKNVKDKKKPKAANKMKKEDLADDTFFNNTSKMCNSTALNATDNAVGKDFACRPIKGVAAVSTTQQSNNSTSTTATAANSATLSKPTRDNTINKQKRLKATANSFSAASPAVAADDDNDCTTVTSTTGMDAKSVQQSEKKATNEQEQHHQLLRKTNSQKGILLYAPNERQMAPSSSFCNGYFNITEEHLSSVIGQRAAHKFLKFYLGRRQFDTSSTVYYRPPATATLENDDSDSDDDIFESVDRYGELHESVEKSKTQ